MASNVGLATSNTCAKRLTTALLAPAPPWTMFWPVWRGRTLLDMAAVPFLELTGDRRGDVDVVRMARWRGRAVGGAGRSRLVQPGLLVEPGGWGFGVPRVLSGPLSAVAHGGSHELFMRRQLLLDDGEIGLPSIRLVNVLGIFLVPDLKVGVGLGLRIRITTTPPRIFVPEIELRRVYLFNGYLFQRYKGIHISRLTFFSQPADLFGGGIVRRLTFRLFGIISPLTF